MPVGLPTTAHKHSIRTTLSLKQVGQCTTSTWAMQYHIAKMLHYSAQTIIKVPPLLVQRPAKMAYARGVGVKMAKDRVRPGGVLDKAATQMRVKNVIENWGRKWAKM